MKRYAESVWHSRETYAAARVANALTQISFGNLRGAFIHTEMLTREAVSTMSDAVATFDSETNAKVIARQADMIALLLACDIDGTVSKAALAVMADAEEPAESALQ